MARIKEGDLVLVTAGKRAPSDYQGEPRKVLRVLPKKDQVVVEGHRVMKKHVRPTKNNPKGGRVEKEAPVHMSNVMPYCQNCATGVRVNYKGSGKEKQRVCNKCSEEL